MSWYPQQHCGLATEIASPFNMGLKGVKSEDRSGSLSDSEDGANYIQYSEPHKIEIDPDGQSAR
jgi:hypothetical protein